MKAPSQAEIAFNLTSGCSDRDATAQGQSFSSAEGRLPFEPIDPARVESGEPIARGATLSRSPDGRLSIQWPLGV